MQFNMRCETFARLNNVLQRFRDNEDRECFRSVLIERKNGSLVAVATNGLILAAEMIGASPGPDAFMNLTIDPRLLTQCRTEAQLNGLMNVTYIPELQHATIKTTFGYQYPDNAALHFTGPNVVRDGWRNIPAQDIERGPMVIHARDVQHLGDASPSGFLIFPAEIDGNKPVIVRDKVDPNWLGFFMPSHYDENGKRMQFEPAILPDWAK